MAQVTPGGTAHRTMVHTADVIIEAWGPTRTACLAEAVRALVETFADVSAASAAASLPLHVTATDGGDLVAAVLEEVLFVLDAHDRVPLAARVTATSDGGVHGSFDVAPLSEVRVTGPAPKGVAGAELVDRGGGWACRAVIDL